MKDLLLILCLTFFLGSVCQEFHNNDTTTATTVIIAKKPTINNPCLCQEFRCEDGLFCLHKTKVCSGFSDCPKGEDEDKKRCQHPRMFKCDNDEFKCKFGGCIKLNQVCNGKIDCWGGVDEASDFCDWVNSS